MSTLALDAPLLHRGLGDGGGVSCDGPALLAMADALRPGYRGAAPYAHAVLSGLVADDVLLAVVAELQNVPDHVLQVTRSRRIVKRETPDVHTLGPATQALAGALDGPEFVAFLGRLTGIEGLVADVSHHAAGLHETRTGGFTKVHTDFKRHPVTRLHHRVNVLLYLNPGWLPEHGGSLELWPADMSALGRTVLPELGTMVVFETSAHTPHGLPAPVAGPEGIARRSLAAYYYSADRPARERTGGGLGSYRARPGEGRWVSLPTPKELAMSLVPERVRRLRDIRR